VLKNECGEVRSTAPWTDASTVFISEDSINGNSSPTCSVIDNQEASPGETINIAFTIGDAETLPENLTVHFENLQVSFKIKGFAGYSISGTGANRNLELQIPTSSGKFGGIVQVSDGELSINEYVEVHAKAASNEAPQFIKRETYYNSYINRDVWSAPMLIKLEDNDTPADSLDLTVYTNDVTYLTDENIMIGGSGNYRTIQYKMRGFTYSNLGNVTFIVSDGELTDTLLANFKVNSQANITNFTPGISHVPDIKTSIVSLRNKKRDDSKPQIYRLL
jgi:hypothetical protein